MAKKKDKNEIVIRLAENPRYKNKEEAWEAVGPIFARLVADAIKRRNQDADTRRTDLKNHNETHPTKSNKLGSVEDV